MRVWQGEEARSVRLAERPVMALGFFDGVHRGHQALVRRAVTDARRSGVPAGVLTFEPHPLVVLSAERSVDLLTTLPEKEELFAGLGVDLMVVYPFSRELAGLPAEAFVRDVLQTQLGVTEVVVGYNFSFGARGGGHFGLLRRMGEAGGFGAVMIPPVMIRRTVVSSSSIRERLLGGEVERAQEMLGYPYFVRGPVGRGEGRGRKLGFPTANLVVPAPKLLPGDGVYLVGVRLPDGGEEVAGVAAVGKAQTFGGEARRVEVHVLDYRGDLYGDVLRVSFRRRLRAMRRFASPEELTRQVAGDLDTARVLWYHQEAGFSPTRGSEEALEATFPGPRGVRRD